MMLQETGGDEEKRERESQITDPVKSIESALKSFVETNTSVKNLFNSFVTIFSQLEGIATSFNKSMGGADIYGEKVKQNMIEAKMEAEKYGFTLENVNNVREKVTGTERTNFLLQGEQYSQLLVQAELTKNIGESASTAAARNLETFRNLGFTVQGTLKGSEEVIQKSLSLGVSANAVFKEINTNVSKLNTFNFADGVDGMAKMATEAIMVKANMAKTLEIANNLFDPQKALEMAAGLQRMGVQITGLLDPISLMNMAENDPEALQANIIELSKQFVEFDEKQQRFKVMPGAQRQLREVAQTLGLGAEEFAKMGMNALDLDRKLSQIKFPDASEFANEDTRKLIANMSQFNEKTGKYEIEIYDEKLGQNVMKAVDALEPADMATFEETQKESAKSSEQLLVGANRYLENILNEIKGGTTRIPFAAASSKFGQEKLDFAGGTIAPLFQTLDEAIFGKGGTKGVKDKFDSLSISLDSVINSLIRGEKSLSQVSTEVGQSIKEGFQGKLQDLSKFGEIYGEKQQSAFEKNPELAASLQITPDMINSFRTFISSFLDGIQLQDGLISPSGGLVISGPKGSFFADKDDSVLLSPNIPMGNTENKGGESSNSTVTASGKVEIEHKFSGVEGWFKDYMLSQGFLADFVPTLEKFLTKTEG